MMKEVSHLMRISNLIEHDAQVYPEYLIDERSISLDENISLD